MKRKTTAAAQAAPLPHSWTVEQWPSTVFPNQTAKARYLLRVHRDDLLRAGAIARVGRELIIFGGPFDRWLKRGAANVQGYRIAPNAQAHTA
jgi:hypothetical protein